MGSCTDEPVAAALAAQTLLTSEAVDRATPAPVAPGPIVRGSAGAARALATLAAAAQAPGQMRLASVPGVVETQASAAEAHRKRSIDEFLRGGDEQPDSMFSALASLPSRPDLFLCHVWVLVGHLVRNSHECVEFGTGF